ncbi:kazrin-like [Sycon ciliatum]|uniref:kazrin-like n=1 Tax=Sycon ciliatum TaxID=27933 RepID=UPI0031F6077B
MSAVHEQDTNLVPEEDDFTRALSLVEQLHEISSQVDNPAGLRDSLLDDLTALRSYVSSGQQLAAASEGSITAFASDLAAVTDERNFLREQTAALRQQLVLLGTDGEENFRVESVMNSLQEQLERSERERERLQLELDQVRVWQSLEGKPDSELKREAADLAMELVKMRDLCVALKQDKKRLKAEKADLLVQMKELYSTLEEKEAEVKALTDVCEARLADSSWSSQTSREDQNQLEMKDRALATMEAELVRVKRQLAANGSIVSSSIGGISSMGSSMVSSSTTGGILRADEDTVPPYSPSAWTGSSSDGGGAGYRRTSAHIAQNGGGVEPSFLHRPQRNGSGHAQDRDNLSPSALVAGGPAAASGKKKSKQRKGFGSLSKIFMRPSKKDRDDLSHSSADRVSADIPMPSPHGLTDEQLQERHQVLEEAKGQPMDRWRAAVVVAWLEVVLCMPQYARACSENIKSGRVLLGMTDGEIESALKMSNVLHRRKLRLALELQKSPENVKYPKSGEMDHIWVATVWLQQLGLSQHSDSLLNNLVDGAVLNSLTRRDMERHLGITRKFHQASLMYGIEVLRKCDFDRQILRQRRAMCEDADTDPLVWTNARFMKWVQTIDLAEYSENLRDSGVHGGIVVLESSFGPEAMATALGILPAKVMIRRHLDEELRALVSPVRATLAAIAKSTDNLSGKKGKSTPSTSLGKAFLKREKDSDQPDSRKVKRRRSLRDSIGRALGRKTKNDMDQDESFDGDALAPGAASGGSDEGVPAACMHTSTGSFSTSFTNGIGSLTAGANLSLMTGMGTADLETTTV